MYYARPGETQEFPFKELKPEDVEDPLRMQRVRELGYTVLRGDDRKRVRYRWTTMTGDSRESFQSKDALYHRGTAGIFTEKMIYFIKVTTYDKREGLPYDDSLSILYAPRDKIPEVKKHKILWPIGTDRDLTGKVDEGDQQLFDKAVDFLLRFFQTDNP